MKPKSAIAHNEISRRQFALIAGTAGTIPLTFAPSPLNAAEPLTAQAIVQRIQISLGGEWPSTGPDGFKAGDPSTKVKGIATTAMATVDVLKQAVQANTNLVVTFEPTFYSRADGQAPTVPTGRGGAVAPPAAPDPVLQAKREYIEKNGLVVYRLRDHWQARKENDMVTALAAALGWSAHRIKADDFLYEIPQATAEQTVNLIRSKLNLRAGLRVVGDRKASIRRVLLFPGSMTTATMWQRYTEADLILAGEVREWENTHFAADLFTAGEKHALVTTGRVVSEEPGMRACADWLKTVVKEVPAKWIGVGDPYWRPA
jgi:putative NIF3 family GTP cyclohydrolase 1 type 2